MKKAIFFFPAILICLLFNTAPATANNIVQNPGFEAVGTKISNWHITGPVLSMEPVTIVDNSFRHSGLNGLKMFSNNPNCHGRAVQLVKVAGGLTYQFRAAFSVREVASIDKSVMIKITWLDGENNLGYDYIYGLAELPEGWLQASNKIKAPEGANAAEISLEFRWSTGTIWWDDISMEPCAAEPSRKVKLGTVYLRPPGPTVEKNLSVMADLIDKAGQSNCQFVCLPEGWVTCNTSLGMQKSEANMLNGPASKMLAQKAKQYGMYIISGQYSWIGDTLNNVAVLYNPKGEMQEVYKKVQLPDSEAQQGAVPGNELPVFQTDYGKIGILICWDYAFPEMSRALALKGAEILFCPIWGDLRGNDGDITRVLARSRAVDNGVYFVSAIYDGYSMIIDPAGNMLQEGKTQGSLLTATVDLNYNPPWNWIGNAGRGVWKGVWRKDRRGDIYNAVQK